MFKRKTLFLLQVALVISILMFAVGCSQTGENNSQADETITLTLASSFPENHFVEASGSQYFMPLVEELSDGKIKFEYFPGGVLGSAKDSIEMLKNGVADIATVGITYFPGAMPLSNVAGLPGAVETVEQGSETLYQLVTDKDSIFYEVDFERNQIVPLVIAVSAPYEVATTEKVGKIESLEDYKGLKLRSGGGPQDEAIAALGAIPIQTEHGEQYEAFARGTVDGGIVNIASLISNRTFEVLQYVTQGAGMPSFLMSICISEKTFNSLPDWAQEVLVQAGKEATSYQGEYFAKLDLEDRKTLENEHGIEFYEAPDIKESIKVVWEKWANDLENLGYPANQAVELWNTNVQKH